MGPAYEVGVCIDSKIVNDTYSDTSRCTLKCINKENMVLNLSEEPITVLQYSRIYTYRYSLSLY